MAQTVCAYPPGIPILVEGERMTESTLEFIEHYIKKIKQDQTKSGGIILGLEENYTKIPIIDD
jgi:arginine/lysine/ornithine decarboxylase